MNTGLAEARQRGDSLFTRGNSRGADRGTVLSCATPGRWVDEVVGSSSGSSSSSSTGVAEAAAVVVVVVEVVAAAVVVVVVVAVVKVEGKGKEEVAAAVQKSRGGRRARHSR